MQIIVHDCRLELLQGDISQVSADAIVNAANHRLAGGGGVDGAIHRAGGPRIMEDTAQRYPQGCRTGSAVISQAGNLPARYVIHAVGPVWRGGNEGEEQLLESAYLAALRLAREHDCESVALPALSTGAYGYPLDRAARTALQTTIGFLEQGQLPLDVRFVLFGAEALSRFASTLVELQADLRSE